MTADPTHPGPDASERPDEVQVVDLHKSFNTNEVLRGVDLEIRRGDIVAVVGASGCGKTVLLEHMIGQLDPDRGRVLIADHERDGAPLVDLATLDMEGMDEIRRHWAVVFQRNALFSDTVYENIALWLREVALLSEPEIAPRVRTALTSVGLEDEKILKVHRDELSGGMQKRVAVARAVAMDPYLIFYDEPTTGLDPHHATQIQDLLQHTHFNGRVDGETRTTVVITHDKDLLHRLEPRVVMLHEGRVFFDGTYDAFEASDEALIRPYFEMMPMLHQRPMQ